IFSSRRRHTRFSRDWSSDVCSSDLQRYQHADDFARDLAKVMRTLDRAVTYLDIKKLVEDTANERAKRRKSQGQDTAGVIGDLIRSEERRVGNEGRSRGARGADGRAA